MSKQGTVSYENLVKVVHSDEGVTLLAGTSYTIGMLLVKQDTGKWTQADIVGSGVADATPQYGYDKQEIGVLLESVDATAADSAGVIATEGIFNENNIVFNGTQVKETLAGVLQAKGIKLEKWSK